MSHVSPVERPLEIDLEPLKAATHCSYCAVDCAMELSETPLGTVEAKGTAHPINRGKLCVLGQSSAGLLNHGERLTQPLIRVKGELVGTANATTAGWGNLGGVTQAVMPLLLAAVVTFGAPAILRWRVAMVIPGVLLFLTGIAYYFVTQDAPNGNYKELRAKGEMPEAKASTGTFQEAAKDPRVIALFFIYAACFGIELTINGTAALYFFDRYGLSLATAGLVASLFGLMNLFARSLGAVAGIVGAGGNFGAMLAGFYSAATPRFTASRT